MPVTRPKNELVKKVFIENEIEVYLAEVKEAIQNNRYRIEKTFVDRTI